MFSDEWTALFYLDLKVRKLLSPATADAMIFTTIWIDFGSGYFKKRFSFRLRYKLLL